MLNKKWLETALTSNSTGTRLMMRTRKKSMMTRFRKKKLKLKEGALL